MLKIKQVQKLFKKSNLENFIFNNNKTKIYKTAF